VIQGFCSRMLALALVLGSCTAAPVRDEAVQDTAEIAVWGYSGLVRSQASMAPSPVYLVADVTSLAGPRGSAAGAPGDARAVSRALGARLLAERWVPEWTPLQLESFDRLGERPPSQCADPEGAWASAGLDRLRARLQNAAREPTPHVILLADIASECRPDLCAAAGAWVADGGWLDVVALGTAAAPECLRKLRPKPTQPGPVVRQLTAEPLRFRVERSGSGPEESRLLARGIANGEAVRVPAGPVRVVVELDGEEAVGPFMLMAGDRVRVRIQSFPLAERPERSWIVDTEPAP